MKYECDCGTVYSYPDGPIHCADNRHGKGKPCPSCADLRAELEEERSLHKWTASLLEAERANAKRLNSLIEWAVSASLQISRDINSGMVEQFSAELRRRAYAREEGG